MRIFVTGATGYLGRRVLMRLHEDEEAQFTALYRHAIPDELAALSRVTWRHGDLAEIGLHRDFFHKADLFVHLAGVFEPGQLTRPLDIQREIVGHLRGLLPQLALSGVRSFVYVGSLAALGDTGDLAWDEDYTRPKGFSCHFEEAHWQALQLVRQQSGTVKTLTALVGPSFGPGDPGWLWRILRDAAQGKLRSIPAPWHFLSPIHVDDLAEGILQLLLKGRDNREYILSGEPVEMMNLLHLLATITRTPPPGKLSAISAALLPMFSRVWNRERLRYLRRASFAFTPARAKSELRWTHGILQERLRAALEAEGLISGSRPDR